MSSDYTDHGALTAEELIDSMAEHRPGDMMRFKHPKAEGWVYVLFVTKREWDEWDEKRT